MRNTRWKQHKNRQMLWGCPGPAGLVLCPCENYQISGSSVYGGIEPTERQPATNISVCHSPHHSSVTDWVFLSATDTQGVIFSLLVLHFRRYVEKELFDGGETAPEKHNLSYFPTVNDLQNHIHQALKDIERGVLPVNAPTVSYILHSLRPNSH